MILHPSSHSPYCQKTKNSDDYYFENLHRKCSCCIAKRRLWGEVEADKSSHSYSGAGEPFINFHTLFPSDKNKGLVLTGRGQKQREHGCSLSLVLERALLVATQCNLGGFGRPSSRGGVPQSWTLVQCLAAGFGDFRRQDTLWEVRIYCSWQVCFLVNEGKSPLLLLNDLFFLPFPPHSSSSRMMMRLLVVVWEERQYLYMCVIAGVHTLSSCQTTSLVSVGVFFF